MAGEVLVLGYLATIFLVIGAFIFFQMRKPLPEVEEEEARGAANKPAGRVARKVEPRQAGGKKKSRLQKARAAAAPVQVQAAQAADSEDEDDGIPEVDEEDVGTNGKLTKAAQKKLKKNAMKQAKEDQKHASNERLEKRSAQDQARHDKRRLREEARLEAEKEAQEAEDEARKAKEQKEQEEFDDWKDLIETETAGTGEAEAAEESQGLLTEFINYIKKRKVVVIEDVAREFNLRSTDAANRIRNLEEMGSITGVLDDRGKFIFITPTEMQAVADTIKTKGRLSLQQLVAECNRLIDLETPPEELLLAEEQKEKEAAAAAAVEAGEGADSVQEGAGVEGAVELETVEIGSA